MRKAAPLHTWFSVAAIVTVTIVLLALPDGIAAADDSSVDRIIVEYKDSSKASLQGAETEPSKQYDVVEVPKDKVKEKMEQLENDPSVASVEKDGRIRLFGQESNDPLYHQQKSFFEDIHLGSKWVSNASADQITVAVVDSGVDLDHPDLKANLVPGFNALHDNSQENEESGIQQKEAVPEDHYGHGTHVAGLVGAETSNNLGVASVSKGTNIMPIKVMEGEEGWISDVVQGIEYAISKDVDIINLSLGTFENKDQLKDVIEKAERKGILVTAAAGNDDVNRSVFPAAYQSVISVGSTNTGSNQRADFSNYGDFIDVATPGTSIFSTTIDGYKYLDGTSMSTGIVSSTMASLMEQYPYLSPDQMKEVILEGTSSLPSSVQLGEGKLNLSQSVQYVLTNNRVAGTNSVETSLEIARSGWDSLQEQSYKANGKSWKGKFVVMATGDKFPDSLSATPLANHLESPILLISRNNITSDHLNELNRLDADYVILVGGEGAVDSHAEQRLREEGYETIRVHGDSRYTTALEVSKTLPFNQDEAIFVTGENFPDAVSVAAYAENAGMPILFVRENRIPSEVEQYVQQKGYDKATIIGGPNVVSDTVANQLGAGSTIRVNGNNRYKTSYEVLKHFSTSSDRVYYATGEKHNDALTGGAWAGKNNENLLLVPPEDLAKDYANHLTYARNKKMTSYKILGGPNAIPVSTAWEIDRLLQY
ncbi:MAG: S8 family serine peptidase [Myxosarcina sp. JB018]|nr:S8 family serine peptidase [Myxosarcina sp. JB018]